MPGHLGNRKKKGPQTAFESLMILKDEKEENKEEREGDCKDQQSSKSPLFFLSSSSLISLDIIYIYILVRRQYYGVSLCVYTVALLEVLFPHLSLLFPFQLFFLSLLTMGAKHPKLLNRSRRQEDNNIRRGRAFVVLFFFFFLGRHPFFPTNGSVSPSSSVSRQRVITGALPEE